MALLDSRAPFLRFAITICLTLLSLVPLKRASALSIVLHSTEHAFQPGRSVKDNLAAAPPSYCLIYELLDRGKSSIQLRGKDNKVVSSVFGFVRFGVKSNVSSVDLRNTLVLSVHGPDPSHPGLADLSTVLSHKSFDPQATEKHIAAAESKKQRLLTQQRNTRTDLTFGRVGGDLSGLTAPKEANPSLRRMVEGAPFDEEGASTFDLEEAKSFSFLIHPQRTQNRLATALSGGDVQEVVEGNYALCFSLDRTATPAGRSGRSTNVIERVEVQILESFSSTSVALADGGLLAESRSAGGEAAGAARPLGSRTKVSANKAYLDAMRRIHGDGVASKSINEFLASQRAQINEEVLELLRLQATSITGGAVAPDPLGSGNLYKPRELRQRSRDLLDATRSVFLIIDATENILERSQRMQKTAESTAKRVWISCFAALAAITGSVWVTFRYVKRIIVKKKLL